MQGWLLEEMNKFTKIGVVTPKYQIQNNFPNKEIWLKKKKKTSKAPPTLFPPWIENYYNKLTKESSLIKLAFFSNYNTEGKH